MAYLTALPSALQERIKSTIHKILSKNIRLYYYSVLHRNPDGPITNEKVNLMKRGTLMVLKRVLVTALGALGLGALAAGPASAQQIPAPDLFDDQVACSSNVPSGMANAAAGIAAGHPASGIDQLLPWAFTPTSS